MRLHMEKYTKLVILYKAWYQSIQMQHLLGMQNTDCHIRKSVSSDLWGLECASIAIEAGNIDVS